MKELNNVLRNLQEKTPLSRFFNLNVLNYEVCQFSIFLCFEILDF